MSLPNESLNLLLEVIREHGPYVFAAPEDADFFRKKSPPIEKKTDSPPTAQNSFAPSSSSQSSSEEAGVRLCSSPVKIEAAPKASAPPISIEVKAPSPKPPIKEEALPAKINVDFSSIRNVLSVVAPELAILNEIPSDREARKIAERWKTKNQTAPISVLLFQEPPEQRALLEQIARALDIYFGPAKVVHVETIEKERQWEAFLSVANLKMVIACDYTLWQLNHLMPFYKETPAQGQRVLGNVPLFLLPDLSLYLKDPLLKRSLWKALCQKFS